MRVLLISTYDLGRQPLGLASPAASLREAGFHVDLADTSREPLDDRMVEDADVIAFYLPMHTATRLAAPLIDRVRRANPAAQVVAYGLYAPLNADWLASRGVTRVIGGEPEAELLGIVRHDDPPAAPSTRRLQLLRPDRSTLPPLAQYAALQMPDGSRRVAGSTESTRGCKHLCRHCPIVPVYNGLFSAVPLDLVLADVRSQIEAGAQHITFGDADFFNGPTHARRLIERFHGEWPDATYDATIKIEHLLRHADMLPLLRETGCLFVTSAVESVDDAVLTKLRKGHTRDDFVRAVGICGDAGVALAPTFVPFTPWTTLDGYVDLIECIERLEIVEQVAPVQLGIRLLVTARSALLELEDIRSAVEPFDPESLTWPWRHADPEVDALQTDVMRIVAGCASRPRTEVFSAIAARACSGAGRQRTGTPSPRGQRTPVMTEAWYCCAEPIEGGL